MADLIKTAQFITIVSGYPRSGTSLMMQMLQGGGMETLHNNVKKPDEHNPRGYYEFDRALKLGAEGETKEWVADACGKAVKVIAHQLKFLPSQYEYRVIFMRRKIREVLASSRKMGLIKEDLKLTERQQMMSFKGGYVVYEAWLMKQPNMAALFVHYNDLLENPVRQVERLHEFLNLPLTMDKMIAAIDPALHRSHAN